MMSRDRETVDFDPFNFDPFKPETTVRHDLFDRIRHTCPVAKIPVGWFLSKQADVLAATRDVETFVASFREPGVVVPEEEKFINEIAEPRHGEIRRIINAAVAHHKTMRVEPMVRQLCEEYLEPILSRGHGELIGELVAPIPVNVISYLIGVVRDDWADFRRWSISGLRADLREMEFLESGVTVGPVSAMTVVIRSLGEG